MKCPVDERELLMTDREGIEIDYCPQCRGVWLDRGELDKLIERSEQTERSPSLGPIAVTLTTTETDPTRVTSPRNTTNTRRGNPRR